MSEGGRHLSDLSISLDVAMPEVGPPRNEPDWERRCKKLRYKVNKLRRAMKGLVKKYHEVEERKERLQWVCSKMNEEVCQVAGKVLGYPWFKDDQKNFPGSTEEHGVCVGNHVAESIVDELSYAYLRERARRLDADETLSIVLEMAILDGDESMQAVIREYISRYPTEGTDE